MCFVSHFVKKEHIPIDDELMIPDDQLPPGTTPPLWVDVPEGYGSQRFILEKLSQLPEMKGLYTTVISKYREDKAEVFCRENKWIYTNLASIAGSEDQCVIVVDDLQPETISRPHNLLVVVTTSGAE